MAQLDVGRHFLICNVQGRILNISTGENSHVYITNKEMSVVHPVDQFIICYIQGLVILGV